MWPIWLVLPPRCMSAWKQMRGMHKHVLHMGIHEGNMGGRGCTCDACSSSMLQGWASHWEVASRP